MSTEDREDNDPLQSLIAEILEAERSGNTVDRDTLLKQHPEHAESLREFFANHDGMKAAASLEEPTLPPNGSGVDDPTGQGLHEEAKISQKAIFYVGVLLAVLSVFFLPSMALGFLVVTAEKLGLYIDPSGISVLFAIAPAVFSVAILLVAMTSRISKPACSIAIAFLGFAGASRAFVAPQFCGLMGLICSTVGIALSIAGLVQRKSAKALAGSVVGLILNIGIMCLSLPLVARSNPMHLIDALEGGRLFYSLWRLTPHIATALFITAFLMTFPRFRTRRGIIGLSVAVVFYLVFCLA